MCGIACLVGPARPDKRALVDAMLDAMAHRGPDGRGMIEDGPLAMGMVRLAIYDPTPAGDQPMVDAATGNTLIFNGAIYNHRDLRRLLRRPPASSGDTACLLRLLVERREAALADLNGIWAFAYWDAAARRLLLCRDRFGVKPLFWTRWRDQVAIASEVRALLSLPGVERRIAPAAVANFLTERMQGEADGGFLVGIRRLPPATTLTVDGDGSLDGPNVYWRLEPAPGSPETLRDLIEDSVRLRLTADVPVATTLSGGLDSTTIAAVAARTGQAIAAYTLRYDADDPEYRLARSVAERYPGIDLRVVEPGADDFPAAFAATADALGEPFADGSMIAHRALMARISADGFKVVLSGLGGDEALAGYMPTYALALAASRLRGGRLVVAARAVGAGGLLARSLPHALPRRMKNWLRARRQRADWGIVASPDLLAEAAPRFASYRAASLFRSYLDDGRERWFLPGFLHYDDHNAMSFGLEARAPFLDRRIVEWGIGARPADLVDRGLGKLALRGLARDLLPRQVVENPTKRGLPAPAARWLLENPDFVMDTLAATRLDGIRAGVVAARFRDAAGAGVIDAATLAATWRVLSLAVWAERTGAAL